MSTKQEIQDALNADILRRLKAIGEPTLDESKRDQMRREVDTLLKYYDSLNETETKATMQQLTLEQEERFKKAELDLREKELELKEKDLEQKAWTDKMLNAAKMRELELREKELEQKTWTDKMLNAAKMRESDLREHELDLREKEIENANKAAERDSKTKEKEVIVESVKQGVEIAKMFSGVATFLIAAGICKDQFNAMLSFEETGVVRSISSRRVLDVFKFLKK